jgi:hypothetical protein
MIGVQGSDRSTFAAGRARPDYNTCPSPACSFPAQRASQPSALPLASPLHPATGATRPLPDGTSAVAWERAGPQEKPHYHRPEDTFPLLLAHFSIHDHRHSREEASSAPQSRTRARGGRVLLEAAPGRPTIAHKHCPGRGPDAPLDSNDKETSGRWGRRRVRRSEATGTPLAAALEAHLLASRRLQYADKAIRGVGGIRHPCRWRRFAG